MEQEIHDKIEKVYSLVQRGATEGERNAAKKALDRLMKKYNLSDEFINRIELRECAFKYVTFIELKLLLQIMNFFLPGSFEARLRRSEKQIIVMLKYSDWVTVECAYEYFRRHMRKEWNRLVIPELRKCRKITTRRKRQEQLQGLFFNNYIIASNLVDTSQLVAKQVKGKQADDARKLHDVEGGQYNKQVVGTNLLEEHNVPLNP